MAIPPIKFVTAGSWGAGEGAPLTPAEVDQNFYSVQQLIDAAAAAAGVAVNISSITVTGNQMTVTMSDASTFGPFTLPKAAFRYRGTFTNGESYGPGDVVKVTNQGVYLVLRTHTAATPFDPDLTDGGSDVYAPIMPAAEQAVRVSTSVAGSSYTAQATDVNKLLRCTNAGGCTVTIPPDVFATDDELYFVQRGASPITFAAGSGVTFLANDLLDDYTAGLGAIVMFKHVGSNQWERTGQFADASTA